MFSTWRALAGHPLQLKYVNKDRKDYLAYTISKRIYGFRYGIYPTNKNFLVTPIGENWIKFLNTVKITNKDYKEIIEMYKNNENVFIYIDPPYLDSYNAYYNSYANKQIDDKNND